MPYLPTWLQINPKDFTEAAAQGGSLGARLGALATEAGMQRERIASSERENAARVGAAQAEAAARLAAEAKSHELARQMQQWELTQRLASEEARARDTLAERTMYGQGVLENRKDSNDIRQQLADIQREKLTSGVPKNPIRVLNGRVWEKNPDTDQWEAMTPAKTSSADELPSVLNDSAVKSSGFSLWHPSTWFGRGAAAPTSEDATGIPTVTGAPIISGPAPAATNAPASPYKVGGNYGGLRYMGGDPNVADSWQPVGDTAR